MARKKTAYQKKMGACLKRRHGNMKACAKEIRGGRRRAPSRRITRRRSMTRYSLF